MYVLDGLRFSGCGLQGFSFGFAWYAVEKSDEEMTKSKEARLYLSPFWAILVERLFLDARRPRGCTF